MWRNHFTQIQEKFIRQQQKKKKQQKTIERNLETQRNKKSTQRRINRMAKKYANFDLGRAKKIWCLYFDQHKGIIL